MTFHSFLHDCFMILFHRIILNKFAYRAKHLKAVFFIILFGNCIFLHKALTLSLKSHIFVLCPWSHVNKVFQWFVYKLEGLHCWRMSHFSIRQRIWTFSCMVNHRHEEQNNSDSCSAVISSEKTSFIS